MTELLKVQIKLFEYDQIDEINRDFIQDRTIEIKALVKRSAQDIIEIGLKLIEVKDRLPHGMFGAWLEAEFGWSETLAQKTMNVARQFKSVKFTDLENFGQSALYLLASPSTPDEAREEALDRASNGEVITHKAAKEIVNSYKEDEPSEDEPELIYDGGYAYCKYCYETHDQWELSVDHHPTAWECRNCGHFTVDQYMDLREKPIFTCPECDQTFNTEVWHCQYCNHHWQFNQRDCPNCYKDKLDQKGVSDVKHLKRDAPKVFEQVRTGELSITEAKKKVARERKPDPAIAPPIPKDKYRCIVIDPPWPIKKIERDERPNQGVELDYPTMTLDEIKALPINDLAYSDGCHLYLWVTQKYLPFGLELVKEWGFRYQCLMTWRKNVGITPYSWMYDTEHVIFATIGSLKLERLGLRLSFDAKTQGHSVKPDIFFNDRVVLASPPPRLEMFARKARHGFAVWGNEVND